MSIAELQPPIPKADKSGVVDLPPPVSELDTAKKIAKLFGGIPELYIKTQQEGKNVIVPLNDDNKKLVSCIPPYVSLKKIKAFGFSRNQKIEPVAKMILNFCPDGYEVVAQGNNYQAEIGNYWLNTPNGRANWEPIKDLLSCSRMYNKNKREFWTFNRWLGRYKDKETKYNFKRAPKLVGECISQLDVLINKTKRPIDSFNLHLCEYDIDKKTILCMMVTVGNLEALPLIYIPKWKDTDSDKLGKWYLGKDAEYEVKKTELAKIVRDMEYLSEVGPGHILYYAIGGQWESAVGKARIRNHRLALETANGVLLGSIIHKRKIEWMLIK